MVRPIVKEQQILIGIIDSRTNGNIPKLNSSVKIIAQNITLDKPVAFMIVCGTFTAFYLILKLSN